MSEIVKFNNSQIKIGSCEDLSYITYHNFALFVKLGEITKAEGDYNKEPEYYLCPEQRFRFRFPFPDEMDKIIGDEYDYLRTVNVTISNPNNECSILSAIAGENEQIEVEIFSHVVTLDGLQVGVRCNNKIYALNEYDGLLLAIGILDSLKGRENTSNSIFLKELATIIADTYKNKVA